MVLVRPPLLRVTACICHCVTVDELAPTAAECVGKLPPALSPCFVPTHRKSSVQVNADDIAAALYRYVTLRSRHLSLVVLQPITVKVKVNVYLYSASS